MANVGSGDAGKTLIGAGNGASPTYASIGTNSGLTANGLVVAKGNGAFQATGTGSIGQVLQSNGAASNPVYSTATYPSTTTINRILYSSATNTIGEIATANSGVLTTNSSGVPSIDTTNFAVLSTGVQMKGNNTNTAPPTGFIGEIISSSATSVSISNGTPANVTSIDLTAGIWNISGIVANSYTGSATALIMGISTNSASFTGTTRGIDQWQANISTSGGVITGTIPTKRVTLSGTTTYYLVTQGAFTTGTASANGLISATRVG